MDIRRALKGQFHAALDMLKRVIELCPDDMWTRADGPVPFWQVAYHTLYFTHLYLHQTHAEFTPWEHHKADYHDLPWPADSAAAPASPYTKAQVLDYWRLCDAFVESALDALDLSAAQSGFPWHADFPKLDHQLQNLRHIQHHTASLSRRLRDAMGDDGDVAWVRFRHEAG
ncbi:MAG: DinB family protein [Phycisphaerales bacterium]|nr:DinB family protein [Phycisphaerales bacterium]